MLCPHPYPRASMVSELAPGLSPLGREAQRTQPPGQKRGLRTADCPQLILSSCPLVDMVPWQPWEPEGEGSRFTQGARTAGLWAQGTRK